MEDLEKTILKYVSEDDANIFNKWKDMEMLPKDGNLLSNIFLAKTYEKFTKFILELSDEPPLWWGECGFTILYIPITRSLYTQGLTDNHELIYNKFEEWYSLYGNQYNYIDIEFVTNFVEYFKEFKNSSIPDDVKYYTNGHGLAKEEFKKETLLKNLEFEKCSGDEKEMVLNELSTILNNRNFNICYFPIYKVNEVIYTVSETNDTIDDLVNHINNGDIISVFSGKFNSDGVIVYRYNINNKINK